MSRAMAPHRQYTVEFKVEAVRLAREVGVTEAARRLDIPVTSVQNWMKPSYAARLEGAGQKGLTTSVTIPLRAATIVVPVGIGMSTAN